MNDRNREYIKSFTRDYLTYDGIFLLRLISHNSSELQTMEILQTLFKKYQRNGEDKRFN